MELERLYRERGGMDKSWLKYWLHLEAASRLKYNHGSTQKGGQSTLYVEESLSMVWLSWYMVWSLRMIFGIHNMINESMNIKDLSFSDSLDGNRPSEAQTSIRLWWAFWDDLVFRWSHSLHYFPIAVALQLWCYIYIYTYIHIYGTPPRPPFQANLVVFTVFFLTFWTLQLRAFSVDQKLHFLQVLWESWILDLQRKHSECILPQI